MRGLKGSGPVVVGGEGSHDGSELLLDRRDHHDAVGKGTASCRCRAEVAHVRQSRPDSGRRDHHDAVGKGEASCFRVQATFSRRRHIEDSHSQIIGVGIINILLVNWWLHFSGCRLLSSECGTYKTVKARFWP